jgi:peptidyl-prolyl cis-trans isomerase D
VGYAVVKIVKVLGRDPVAADAKGAQSQYGKAWADAEGQAYYAALKARFKVEIRPNVLTAVDPAASSASGNSK